MTAYEHKLNTHYYRADPFHGDTTGDLARAYIKNHLDEIGAEGWELVLYDEKVTAVLCCIFTVWKRPRA